MAIHSVVFKNFKVFIWLCHTNHGYSTENKQQSDAKDIGDLIVLYSDSSISLLVYRFKAN